MQKAITAPNCCQACQSRTIRAHCKWGCGWVVCLKCLATSGRVRGKLAFWGGVQRYENRSE